MATTLGPSRPASADSGVPVALILLTAQKFVLPSVEAMARAYGVNLLAAVTKPVTAKVLEEIISRYSAPIEDAGVGEIAVEPGLRLEQIVQGIENDEFEPHSPLQPLICY